MFIFSTKSVYYKLTYLGIPKIFGYFANGYISKKKIENDHIANGYILQYAHINTREESKKIVFSHSKLRHAVEIPNYFSFR